MRRRRGHEEAGPASSIPPLQWEKNRAGVQKEDAASKKLSTEKDEYSAGKRNLP